MSQLAACLDISPNGSCHWGIRLPHRVYYWQTGKPGMDDSFTSNNADAVRFPVHTKGSMADCTCIMKPTITLLYSHIYTPALK